jgi:hypothetical protein
MRKSLLPVVLSLVLFSGCSETQVKETLSSIGQGVSDAAAKVTAGALEREIKSKSEEYGVLLGSISVLEAIKTAHPELSIEYTDLNGDGLDDDGRVTVVVGSGAACIDFISGISDGRCP